jgi:AcrR family transcriptional regulator
VGPEANNRENVTEGRLDERRGAFDGSSRGRLLTALGTVIAHGGYREATVERVLEAAHVSWSDFSREFEDLDALFLATLDAGMECAVAAAERRARAASAGGDPGAALAGFLDGLLEAVAAHPELTRLCLVESAALGARAVERKQAGLQRFVASIADLLGTGEPGAAVPPLAAEMVVGGIHEVLQRKARADELGDVQELPEELSRLWLPVIRATTRGAPDV